MSGPTPATEPTRYELVHVRCTLPIGGQATDRCFSTSRGPRGRVVQCTGERGHAGPHHCHTEEEGDIVWPSSGGWGRCEEMVMVDGQQLRCEGAYQHRGPHRVDEEVWETQCTRRIWAPGRSVPCGLAAGHTGACASDQVGGEATCALHEPGHRAQATCHTKGCQGPVVRARGLGSPYQLCGLGAAAQRGGAR